MPPPGHSHFRRVSLLVVGQLADRRSRNQGKPGRHNAMTPCNVRGDVRALIARHEPALHSGSSFRECGREAGRACRPLPPLARGFSGQFRGHFSCSSSSSFFRFLPLLPTLIHRDSSFRISSIARRSCLSSVWNLLEKNQKCLRS